MSLNDAPVEISYGTINSASEDELMILDDCASESLASQSWSFRRYNSSSLNESYRSVVSLHHITPGAASIPSEVVNMTKNLVGGGVLSLSGGVSRFANHPAAAIAVVEWIVMLGAVFGYFCLLIGKSCDMTHSTTYRECWEKSVGPTGGRTVAVVNTLDPLVGIFANAAVLSQSLQLLLEGCLNIFWSVEECLIAVTVVGILPLCLLKNLNALAPFSAVGMAAVFYTLAFLMIRYLDGSYQPGGIYYTDIPPELQPSFGTRNRPWSTDALPFVTCVYTAYDMHFNSPRYYSELRNATIPRFRQTVSFSFGITAVIYVSIAVAGFLTFGANSNSYILNNYSTQDPLASLCRLAIGLCSLVTYPLNFIGVRDNCLDILGIAEAVDTAAKLKVFTILLLLILTIIACFFTDLGLIMSIGGGTTVALVDFVFPALMFREGVRKYRPLYGAEQREVWLVMFLMVVCVALGLVGVRSSILENQ